MYFDVTLSGFGGQGVLLMGEILAYAAMLDKKHVTWMPSYGVEMRGGAANCTVVISSKKIGSPLADEPQGLIAMSKPALQKFQPKVKIGGLLAVNTSFVDETLITRDDVKILALPASDIAYREVGERKMANMVILGAFLSHSGVVRLEKIEESLHHFFEGKKQKLIPVMMRALHSGKSFFEGEAGDFAT
ncbi:MAG: 2-oxoacid:acceptor oxidoreductase family protein [Dethiobacteria bacterium]